MHARHALDSEQLADFLEQQHRRCDVPGLAATVIANGEIVWSHAVGVADLDTGAPFTLDTVCHWFSMTKIAAVTAAMQLVDRGALDLDAPVAHITPGLLPDAFSAVTMRHLAQHSAGFTNPLPLRWVHPAGQPAPEQRAFVDTLLAKQREPRFAPGTTARYSNVSTMVLGEVVAHVAGQTLTEYVIDHILRPLGMTASGFSYTPAMLERAAVGYGSMPRVVTPVLRRYFPDGIVGARHGRRIAFNHFEMDAAACSGLIGTITDAARFAAMHLNEGTVDGVTILEPKTARAMRDITLLGKPYDLGLGWFRRQQARQPRLNHVEHLGGGGGFWNTMRIYPEAGVAVVIMGNTTKRYDVGGIADHLASVAIA